MAARDPGSLSAKRLREMGPTSCSTIAAATNPSDWRSPLMENGTDDQDKKTDWAENRTDWAEDRTVLANERTFAGWMRTGMASVALALGLKAVFREAEPDWLPRAVSLLFIAIAIGIFWAARAQSVKAQARLNTHDAEAQSTRLFTVSAATLTVACLTVGYILWTL